MSTDHIWDDADSPGPALLARRFEAAWRDTGHRPDPADFLPGGLEADPAALLAVLRADLALRRQAGEPAGVESYLGRFPGLAGAVLVALLYEEYCLREESGEVPDPAEYEARFPEVAAELRQVLEIHGLLRAGRSTLPAETRPPLGPSSVGLPAPPPGVANVRGASSGHLEETESRTSGHPGLEGQGKTGGPGGQGRGV
jgi:hypothetical protein